MTTEDLEPIEHPAEEQSRRPRLTGSARSLLRAFAALLVADVIAVTVLAVVKPEYGWLPLFLPPALGVIGMLAFIWGPRLLPLQGESLGEMMTTRWVFFNLSITVLSLSQSAAVLIAAGCLAAMVIALFG